MTENSTALLFDILDTATQGDPDSAANNIALLNQLLSATDNDPSNISANEIALLTEILSIITDQPPDVAANEIAVLTEILAAIQTQNPQVRANKIALLNEIAANSGSLSDVLNIVAPSDLVAWYPFRQGTGVDATAGIDAFGDTTDYSATVNGATYKPSGGVTDIQTGANSGAFEFDGTDDDITSNKALPTDVHGTSPRTVMYWVKPQVIRDAGQTHVLLGADNQGDSFGALHRDNNGNARLRFVGFGNSFDFDTGKNLSLNSFQHIALTYDGSVVCVFVNGTETPISGVSRSLNTPQREINIAQRQDNILHLDGLIDGVRVYDTNLPQSQINQIYLNTEP
ncbi:hypothetical protein 7865G3C2_7 [Haloquadratum phage sp.]|nr:hypothetical protein 7865G3C2_7 [Haloquadratum phage sp.]